MKQCKKCGENKFLDDFGTNNAKPDGKQVNCKDCMTEKSDKGIVESLEPNKNLEVIEANKRIQELLAAQRERAEQAARHAEEVGSRRVNDLIFPRVELKEPKWTIC